MNKGTIRDGNRSGMSKTYGKRNEEMLMNRKIVKRLIFETGNREASKIIEEIVMIKEVLIKECKGMKENWEIG